MFYILVMDLLGPLIMVIKAKGQNQNVVVILVVPQVSLLVQIGLGLALVIFQVARGLTILTHTIKAKVNNLKV